MRGPRLGMERRGGPSVGGCEGGAWNSSRCTIYQVEEKKKEERKERNREEAHLRVFPEAPLWMPFSAVQQLLDTARSPGCSRCSANLL